MSFAGNVTFTNAQPLREAAAAAPADLLLVETDAPFLTPVPYRGKPNSPALAADTVRASPRSRTWPRGPVRHGHRDRRAHVRPLVAAMPGPVRLAARSPCAAGCTRGTGPTATDAASVSAPGSDHTASRRHGLLRAGIYRSTHIVTVRRSECRGSGGGGGAAAHSWGYQGARRAAGRPAVQAAGPELRGRAGHGPADRRAGRAGPAGRGAGGGPGAGLAHARPARPAPAGWSRVEIDPVLAAELPRTVAARAPDLATGLAVVARATRSVSTATTCRPPPSVLVAQPALQRGGAGAAAPAGRPAVAAARAGHGPGRGGGPDVARRRAAGSTACRRSKLAWFAAARRAGPVPRSVFWPVPNVDSRLVAFTRREPPATAASREEVFAVVDAAFGSGARRCAPRCPAGRAGAGRPSGCSGRPGSTRAPAASRSTSRSSPGWRRRASQHHRPHRVRFDHRDRCDRAGARQTQPPARGGPPRADGYHDLVTVFHAVSLFDEITATPGRARRGHGQRRGRGPAFPPTGTTWRCARVRRAAGARCQSAPGVAHHDPQADPGGGRAGRRQRATRPRPWSPATSSGDRRSARRSCPRSPRGSAATWPFALLGGTAVGRGRGEQLTPALAPATSTTGCSPSPTGTCPRPSLRGAATGCGPPAPARRAGPGPSRSWTPR